MSLALLDTVNSPTTAPQHLRFTVVDMVRVGCSFPGASALLLHLRMFHILPDSSADLADSSKKGSKGTKDGKGSAAAGGAQGLITDLRSAQTFSRPLSIRDLKQLNRQLMPIHDMVRQPDGCLPQTHQ